LGIKKDKMGYIFESSKSLLGKMIRTHTIKIDIESLGCLKIRCIAIAWELRGGKELVRKGNNEA
jgi:hypothetical protein